MKFYLKESRITDEDIISKLAVIFTNEYFEKSKELDMEIRFFNCDLKDAFLKDEVSFLTKKEHLQFVKIIRKFFEEKNIKINVITLFGSVESIEKDSIIFDVKRSKYQDYRRNYIIPNRERYMYEDSKKELDFMLSTNQISEEEYFLNMKVLEDELGIISKEKNNVRYIN